MSAAARLERILASIPDAGDREYLLEALPAWFRRAHYQAVRDKAVREFAEIYLSDRSSGRDMASDLAQELRQAARKGRGPGAATEDYRQGIVRLVVLCRRCRFQLPSEAAIRRILAGLATRRGSRKPPAMSHELRDSNPRPGAALRSDEAASPPPRSVPRRANSQ